MSFDPNPITTKNPEVYRLNKVTRFLRDSLWPNTAGLTTLAPAKGVYGDTGGSWQQESTSSLCYDASDPSIKEGDKKESSYFLDQSLSSANYQVETTLNFGAFKTHMGIWLRTSFDNQLRENYQGKWPNFAGIKGYNFSFVPKKTSLTVNLWKTKPPAYLLNDPDLLIRKVVPINQERLSFKVKTKVQGSQLQAFVDLNNNGLIEEDKEKVLEFSDSGFSSGGIGFSIYNPRESRSCFADYQLNYLQQSFYQPKPQKTNQLISGLKAKIKKCKI